MHHFFKLITLVFLSSSAGLVQANYDLLQQKNCFACHYMDKRKYGPNFKEISAKYAKVSTAEELLAKKIRAGGTGVWGEDMMPPQPQVSDAEARVIAKFILSLK
jgi:cytochrome c